MGVQVGFDYATWVARYPEFAGTVTSALADIYFTEATLYQKNDGSGPIEDANQQSMLLNMLVAHIAQINSGSSILPVVPLVGTIGNASEGSVSVSATLPPMPGTAAWYVQTKYGLAWWQATAVFRTFRYRVAPRRVFQPYIYGGGGPFW